jgi:translation initiation factor IF-2
VRACCPRPRGPAAPRSRPGLGAPACAPSPHREWARELPWARRPAAPARGARRAAPGPRPGVRAAVNALAAANAAQRARPGPGGTHRPAPPPARARVGAGAVGGRPTRTPGPRSRGPGPGARLAHSPPPLANASWHIQGEGGVPLPPALPLSAMGRGARGAAHGARRTGRGARGAAQDTARLSRGQAPGPCARRGRGAAGRAVGRGGWHRKAARAPALVRPGTPAAPQGSHQCRAARIAGMRFIYSSGTTQGKFRAAPPRDAMGSPRKWPAALGSQPPPSPAFCGGPQQSGWGRAVLLTPF